MSALLTRLEHHLERAAWRYRSLAFTRISDESFPTQTPDLNFALNTAPWWASLTAFEFGTQAEWGGDAAHVRMADY